MCGIYLDYQSAMPVDPRVLEFAERYLTRSSEIPPLCTPWAWLPSQPLRRPEQKWLS